MYKKVKEEIDWNILINNFVSVDTYIRYMTRILT